MARRSSLLVLAMLLAACGASSSGGSADSASATGGSTSGAAGAAGSGGSGGTAGASVDVGGNAGAESAGAAGTAGSGPVEDLDAQPQDFECLKNWTAVRQFRLINKLGHMDEALAVSASTTGGVYPVGTIIQLIPTEAMVKRRAGFSADTGDWELFTLKVSANGTVIGTRGAGEVVNALGGSCLGCHSKAAPQWDKICEDTHGCDPLPFTDAQIQMVQEGDPRCQ